MHVFQVIRLEGGRNLSAVLLCCKTNQKYWSEKTTNAAESITKQAGRLLFNLLIFLGL